MSNEALSKAAQTAWGVVTKLAHGPMEPIGAVRVVLKESLQAEDGIKAGRGLSSSR